VALLLQLPESSPLSAVTAASAWTTWIFAGSSFTAVVGGAWAAFQYFAENKRDREQRVAELKQRESEHRWRCAQAGKGLLDELHGDSNAAAALQMLDSWSRSFIVAGNATVITDTMWLAALQAASDSAGDPVGSFVRDAFDALYYHMAMLEHHVRNDFVLMRDVEFPLEYYVAILAEDKPIHQQYLRHFCFEQAEAFLNRFASWTSPSGKVLQSRVGSAQSI
jgi:hypothetical protein